MLSALETTMMHSIYKMEGLKEKTRRPKEELSKKQITVYRNIDG